MAAELSIGLHLESTHLPGILDLEGTIPFDIILPGRRGASDLTRQMNILTDDSVFDIPHALSKGLLRFIDLGSKEQVDLAFVDTSPKPTVHPRILSLPPRTSRLRLFEYDFEIPLQLNAHVRPVLVPGHKYRVELSTSDLGVRWWSYGDEMDFELRASKSSLPPSEPANLVAGRSIHRDFSVIKSLPKPPNISVSMSLSSDVLHRSKSPSTYLCVTVTNMGDQTITLRSSRDQHFIEISNLAHNTPNHHRITSTNPSPSIDNFSITSISTGEEFIREPRHTCSVNVGGEAISRRGLTTLEPGVPLTHEFALLERADAIVKSMSDSDQNFCLRLRPLGVEWFAGSLEDVFGDKASLKRLPGPCVPLMLQSDDELLFRLED